MGRFFKKRPKKGDPISVLGYAAGVAALARAWEEFEGIGCHLEWSIFNTPRLIIDTYKDETSSMRQAWELEIDGTTATVYDCLYMRGPVSTHTASVAVADFDAVGNTVFLYARISTTSGVVEVLTANSIANATDATIPTADDYFKKLLYRLERASSEAPFYATMDYRTAIEVVARL